MLSSGAFSGREDSSLVVSLSDAPFHGGFGNANPLSPEIVTVVREKAETSID
jgi:hypothetical protein